MSSTVEQAMSAAGDRAANGVAGEPPPTLSGRLLRKIFPWYLLLGLSATLVQLLIQDLNASAAIASDLASLAQTVGPSVSNAVWEMDPAELEAALRGIRQNAIVTGVRVEDADGRVLASDGELPPPRRRLAMPGGLNEAVLPLTYTSPRGDVRAIGRLSLYSGPRVVWDRTKYGVLVVVVNSVVVTLALWLLFAWTVRRYLAGTVSRLAAAVRRLDAQPGDAPPAPVAYPYRDEVGELVDAFNQGRERLFHSMLEQKQLNRDLDFRQRELERANRALAQSNQELEQFAFAASHDLQTPLRAIAGYAQMLSRKFGAALGEEGAGYAGQIVLGAQRLSRLVRSLLDYSLIGKEPDRHWVSLDATLNEVRDDLEGVIRERGAVIESGPLPTLHVDARQARQLLGSLVGNAIKFQPGERPVVRSAARQEGNGWVVSVADEGIGIEPRHQQRIFQMFQRLHPPEQFDGDGIGLTMADKIVRLHGGKLWVESARGKGATFSFSIPD